jgi:hypothetical protein
VRGHTALVFGCGLLSLMLTAASVQLHVLNDGVNGIVIEFLRRWMPASPQGDTGVAAASSWIISDASVITLLRLATAILCVTGISITIVRRTRGEAGQLTAVGATLCVAALLWQLGHFRPWRYFNLGA